MIRLDDPTPLPTPPARLGERTLVAHRAGGGWEISRGWAWRVAHQRQYHPLVD